jgi:hypothetical protein
MANTRRTSLLVRTMGHEECDAGVTPRQLLCEYRLVTFLSVGSSSDVAGMWQSSNRMLTAELELQFTEWHGNSTGDAPGLRPRAAGRGSLRAGTALGTH